MCLYVLENDYEYLISRYLDKIDECIINLYDKENKYDNYILKHGDDFAIIRLLIQNSKATLVFCISNMNDMFILKETKKLIIKLQNKFNIDISVLLLKSQIRYIEFFKSIGFVQNIIYRDYILIDNKYYDILSYTLYGGRLNDRNKKAN